MSKQDIFVHSCLKNMELICFDKYNENTIFMYFYKKVNLQKQIRSYKIFSFTVVSFEKPFTLEAHYSLLF
jgi:hypothetical protein